MIAIQEFYLPTLPAILDQIRRPLCNRIHGRHNVALHVQWENANIHNPQILRPMHPQFLVHHPTLVPRQHGTCPNMMILCHHHRFHLLFNSFQIPRFRDLVARLWNSAFFFQ